MDDLLSFHHHLEEAMSFIKALMELLEYYFFQINNKYYANDTAICKELIKVVDSTYILPDSLTIEDYATNGATMEDEASDITITKEDESQLHKCLGLHIQTAITTDPNNHHQKQQEKIVFPYWVDHLPKPHVTIVTKRMIAQILGGMHDVLGFLQPIAHRWKVLLQMAWRLKVSWDQDIYQLNHTNPKIMELKKQLLQKYQWGIEQNSQVASDFELDKYDFENKLNENDQIIESTAHVFADASTEAVYAVAYQRSVIITPTGQEKIIVGFWTRKGKMAPIPKHNNPEKLPLTIPKSEMLGVVVGHLLYLVIQEALHLSKVTYWTDSYVALAQLISGFQANPDKLASYPAAKIQNY